MLRMKWIVVLPGLLAVLPGLTLASGLLFHDGFETCWHRALTKPAFLTLLHDSVDGTNGCVPPQSGTEFGITYTACNTPNGCGTGVPGCAVAMQAGAFSGDFLAGSFTAPGTASNVAIPIDAGFLGACTLNLTAITLRYDLDYLVRVDGVDGVHAEDLATPVVEILDYTRTHDCNIVIAGFIDSYTPQAIASAEAGASAAIEPPLRTNTVGQSVCPLSAP